jgi:hypothetical protein
MRLTGTLLDIEDYSGTGKGDDGKPFDYSGQRLHVLDGREVVKVKVPTAMIPTLGLGRGEAVDLRVQVQAQSGARGAYLTTVLLGTFEASEAFSF